MMKFTAKPKAVAWNMAKSKPEVMATTIDPQATVPRPMLVHAKTH